MDSGQSAGRKVTKKHPFEGVIPNMERRYRETDSVAVREELARYRSLQPCPDCGGTRLRSEARHVKVGEGEQARAIYEIGHVTLRESFDYFDSLKLHGAKAEIADKVIREIGAAAEIPQRRGPELPEPGPQRRDAVGRRGAAHPPGLADRLRA